MALIIKGGTLIDGTGSPPVKNGAIVIEGRKIARVVPYLSGVFDYSDRDTIINADNKWIIPGMINCHDHILLKSLKKVKVQSTDVSYIDSLMNLPSVSLAFICLANANAELQQGVTTIRDMGSPFGIASQVRDAIQNDIIYGPKILSSGQPVSTIGGHFTPISHGVRGEEAVRKAVEEQIRKGVNFIKIMASGGLSNYPNEIPGKVELLPEEIRMAVETAHQNGMLVASHTQSELTTQYSIEASVDSIEHGFVLNELLVKKMKEKGTSYVPTACVLPNVLERAIRSSNDSMIGLIEGGMLKRHKESFLMAYHYKVLIGAGTDSSGIMSQEIKTLVDWGMSEMDAILAATSNAAKIAGISTSVGTLIEGKVADIVILNSDPMKNIDAISKVYKVIARGDEIPNEVKRI